MSLFIKFHRETLGFEIATEIAGHAAFLRAPGTANDHNLGLFQVGNAARPPRSRGADQVADGLPLPGLYHLAWEVGSLPELAEIRGELAAHGAVVGASDHRVSKSLYAKDPDGIEFEVMARPGQGLGAGGAEGRHDRATRPGHRARPVGDLVTGAAAGSAT